MQNDQKEENRLRAARLGLKSSQGLPTHADSSKDTQHLDKDSRKIHHFVDHLTQNLQISNLPFNFKVKAGSCPDQDRPIFSPVTGTTNSYS